MVFSSYGNSSSLYLPLDSDQGVTSFYKNENAALFTAAPTSVVCRGNQDNADMSPGDPVQPFGNNSHGTVVVDAVRRDFAPVAHLSSNGYYGYVPPQKMMSTPATAAAVNAAACDVQLEDAAMDCGEMENFQQLQQNQHQHQRKRKEYGEEAMAASKRRKTWLEEEQQQAGFPQTFGWNQLPYAPYHQQMDCHVEDTPMTTTTVIGSCNGTFTQTQPATTIPVATVTPIQHPVQPPKNRGPFVDDGHSGGSVRRDLLGRWNIAMPTSRPAGTGCSTVSQLSEKLHSSHQQTFGGGGQELEDLFVSLHGSGFFLAG